MAIRNPYNNSNGTNQYMQNKIMMASPEELTLMLYNGAIKFINQGMIFIEEKSIQKAHEAIVRANDIITELNGTLDMQYEVAKGLRPIYDFIIEQLVEANIKKDKQILEEVLSMVTELRDTWKHAMDLAKKK
ncbi:flagellar export chaperone FliS [Clostridiaceae bacterium 35-E11]